MAPGLSSKRRPRLGLGYVLLSPYYRLAEDEAPTHLWRMDGKPHGEALNFIHSCPQPCEAHLRQGGLLDKAVGLRQRVSLLGAQPQGRSAGLEESFRRAIVPCPGTKR